MALVSTAPVSCMWGQSCWWGTPCVLGVNATPLISHMVSDGVFLPQIIRTFRIETRKASKAVARRKVSGLLAGARGVKMEGVGIGGLE